jgi:tRNA A-37 threonylcarbamoyl transferase component Bud32
MTDAERIADLLLEWEDRREHGADVPAEELCRDCPHLLPELARRINALNVTSWMSEEDGDPPSAPPASTTPPPLPLGGRYRLDTLIGEGGFGEVWKGYDLELRRAVAVKRPKRSRLGTADRLERFVAEARRVAGLKHPGVVPVFDVGRDGDAAYIVSELVEGGSLADRIATNRPTVQESAGSVAEVADTLAYAHRHGFLHRDIKPANILIDHHGRALVADFGIARSPDDGAEPTSFGTLAYMAPEQVEGKPADHRADIYSLGVVLYELLVGRLPHTAADPVALRREIVSGPPPLIPTTAGVPERVAAVCLKCLSRDPASRYPDAKALAHDLRVVLGMRPPKRQGMIVLAVAALAVLFCVTGWVYFTRQPAPEPRPTAAERAGAEWVYSVGGKVNDARRVGDLAEPWPVHFAYLHRDHCDERVTDTGLSHLSGCPDLRTLNLGGAKIDGSGLAHLRGATKVTWLSLECTGVTDAGLAHLSASTELTYLNLLCTPVTDAAVETLLGFRKLEMVILTSTGVSRRGVERLRSGLPGCRVVWQPPA